MSESHYDALGVEPTASRDEMRDAYRARVDELTAARDRKGITESQLQDNRDEVAKVRSAWSVLSDPFQRQRYDTQIASGTTDADEDDLSDASSGSEVELTGWRRLMAPPPQKAASGAKEAGGKSAGAKGKQAPPPPRRQPTIPLPPGTQIAAPRVRGMALLFDLAVVLVLMFVVNAVVPNAVQSDYADKSSQIQSLGKAADAQSGIDDAHEAVSDAEDAVTKAETGSASAQKSAQTDLKDAQSDLKDARKDFSEAQSDFNEKQRSQKLDSEPLPHDEKQLDDMAKKLSDDIWGTQIIVSVVILVIALVYLVPIVLRTGSTFGMRGRKIKIVRVDGSRATFVPVCTRFALPLVLGLAGSTSRQTALATILPLAALGMVLWCYRDPNGQGLHDKLARTLVVDA